MPYTDVHEWPVAIDFHGFQQYIEKKYGFNHGDYAGRGSPEGIAEAKAKKDAYLSERGFSNYEHALKTPVGSKEDWPKDSPEMALRIKISTALRDAGGYGAFDRPHQSWWHEHCDNINRGGCNYIDLSDESYKGKKEPWVCSINAIWREELKDHPAYDAKEQYVRAHIDW